MVEIRNRVDLSKWVDIAAHNSNENSLCWGSYTKNNTTRSWYYYCP